MKIVQEGKIVNRKIYISHEIYTKVQKMKEGKLKFIKTRDRRSRVMPEMIGMRIQVYNGKDYKEIFIKEDMVGFTLGSFVPTRFFKSHGGAKKKDGGKKK